MKRAVLEVDNNDPSGRLVVDVRKINLGDLRWNSIGRRFFGGVRQDDADGLPVDGWRERALR